MVDSPDGRMEEVLDYLGRFPFLGLDLETTGLDPHRDRIRLLTLATEEGAITFDLFRVPQALEALKPLLASPRGPVLVGHNLKFDLGFLLKAGLEVEGGRLWDTGLVHQVLNAEARMPSLKELVPELDKTLQTSDWAGPLSQEQLAYAALDALVLHGLYQEQHKKVNQRSLGKVVAIEHRALPAIAWMELSGAPFDPALWEEAVAEGEGSLRSIQEALPKGVNWNSPQQVLRYLRELGLNLPNTTEETLAQHQDHPLVAALLRYREAAKRLSTYGEKWAEYVHPTTGRIHPSWQQVGAETGRMACRKPNLQNIPRDQALRRAFRAPQGRVLVKADFSQIELRIAAAIAREERMLRAFEEGQDLHTLTASLVLGKDPKEVTKEDRQLAKALNFGLLYGLGAEGLRKYALAGYGLRLGLEEAQRLREAFFRTYPALRRWHLSQPEGEVEVRTLTGRRRVTDRFTEKLNTPVQGTGADGLKLALALLWERRHQVRDTFPVLAVHDEVVVEAPEGAAHAAQDWLVQAMREGMAEVVGEVPIEVEVGVYRDWGVTPLAVGHAQ
ncbi:bifunctional 3'-5' exonuclease/DNA polymerase [Thermus sp.]|uniref:bifunctional 3'-5' exonuclease/DNA polymerase n=1 Tax=Thermus sp. TaxID=275 RepID=UPI0025E863A5|nr:bifunctional 3'-5' exonuclease/DNA polymerase [Thermus sp.]